MAAKKTEYKRLEREGEKRLVRVLPNGGEVRKYPHEFNAYDAKGRYLGFTGDEDQAVWMAANGFPNRLDDCNELSLWLAWNDAVDSGNHPVEDSTTGEQFIMLRDGVVMCAKRDKHGWGVQLYDLDTFWDTYSESGPASCLSLPFAEKPYVLE